MAPLVEVSGLTKHYGDLAAVRDVTFAIEPGEVYALLGPNGAGKTTTLRMLVGILQPTGGQASIAGLDCFRQRAEIMRLAGYLPDEPAFHNFLRGREIISFVGTMHGLSKAQTRLRAAELMDRLEMKDAMEDFAVNYSHGMKKKLAAICALLHEPTLLILDEPTNGLDPYATRTMHELISDAAAKGKSVLLSTHLLEQAQRLCTRIGVLHRGQLTAQGPLDELRERFRPGGSLEDVFFAITQQTHQEQGESKQ